MTLARSFFGAEPLKRPTSCRAAREFSCHGCMQQHMAWSPKDIRLSHRFHRCGPDRERCSKEQDRVAATFIDPYDYLDVPAASFPKAFPVVGARIIEDITNLCGHQRDFRMLNLFGHYHFLTVCKPPARLTFNTFLCGRIEVGRDRGQGRPLQGDCARSRGLALRQHERVTLK
jgi:hypothetical protein